MQADDVGLPEQLLQRPDRAGVAVSGPVGGVVEDDVQADGLGDVAQLRADVAVTDDAQGAAAHLVAALGGLVPDPVVHALGLLGQPAGQGDQLAQHDLDHAAGVGEGGVEDGHAAGCGCAQVDLVRADAEAAHADEVLRRRQNTFGDLGVRTDAEQPDAR